jgi:2-polyprenyl-3-methyl-5-hydroxy-6-metoxy-1,4-benzoquinol methylase
MRKATDVFGEWAQTGKDIGMQEGHALSVNEMLAFALKERSEIDKNFSFLDVGCGNG